MNEFRLNFKFQKWILIGYICWFFLGVLNIIFSPSIPDESGNVNILKEVIDNFDVSFDIFMIFMEVFLVVFPLCGLYFIIQANVYNKYYYVINTEGIYNNQFNLLKKNIKWDSGLYYMITDNFLELYSAKQMLPLEGKIINKNRIKYGYVSIKTKKSLELITDNKGWIVIPTKCLKDNIQVDNIVDMINKSRGIEE
jgi:hypothetical protein